MKATIVKLVVFLLVCAFFTGYLAFTIGNIRPFRGTYDLTATFDDVTGLLPNDNVKIAGVVVGKVKSIGVEKGRAVVHFEVEKDVKVPTDTEAAVRWRNLLGQRYVYLYPGKASTTLQDKGRITETRSVVDLGELFNRLGPIVKAIEPAKVNEFLDAIVAGLDGNEEKVRQALDDLARLTTGLAERDDAIQRLIDNLNTVVGTINSRDAQIRTVLDNLVTISSTFSQNTAILDTAITDLGDISDDLGPLLRDNRAQIDSIANSLTTLIGVVRTKLPTLDAAVAGLDEASAAIFRSASYGEFLNQEILCASFGYQGEIGSGTPVASTDCTPESAKPVVGAGAVRSLVGRVVAP